LIASYDHAKGEQWYQFLCHSDTPQYHMDYTVNFGYIKLSFKSFLAITDKFEIGKQCPSLFYVKKYGYNELGYNKTSAMVYTFLCPNLPNCAEIQRIS